MLPNETVLDDRVTCPGLGSFGETKPPWGVATLRRKRFLLSHLPRGLGADPVEAPTL